MYILTNHWILQTMTNKQLVQEDLSPERLLYHVRTATVKQLQTSGHKPKMGSTPGHTDWPSDIMWCWLDVLVAWKWLKRTWIQFHANQWHWVVVMMNSIMNTLYGKVFKVLWIPRWYGLFTSIVSLHPLCLMECQLFLNGFFAVLSVSLCLFS
jgi:hypothetical protein